MDKFMYYIPYWFKRAKDRYFRWDGEFQLSGIVLCYLSDSIFTKVNQCIIDTKTNNKSITVFIRFGVRLY